MPVKPLVNIYAVADPKSSEKLNKMMSNLAFGFNTKFNPRAVEYAIGVYKQLVLKYCPTPEMEDQMRYGYKNIDESRMHRARNQLHLKEALANEDPGRTFKVIGNGLITASFGNTTAINKQSGFFWKHKRKHARGMSMKGIETKAGYESRKLDSSKLTTLQDFEYGATYTVTPRNPGEKLHPYVGPIRYDRMGRELGFDVAVKHIVPQRMFSRALLYSKPLIEKSIMGELIRYFKHLTNYFPDEMPTPFAMTPGWGKLQSIGNIAEYKLNATKHQARIKKMSLVKHQEKYTKLAKSLSTKITKMRKNLKRQGKKTSGRLEQTIRQQKKYLGEIASSKTGLKMLRTTKGRKRK